MFSQNPFHRILVASVLCVKIITATCVVVRDIEKINIQSFTAKKKSWGPLFLYFQSLQEKNTSSVPH